MVTYVKMIEEKLKEINVCIDTLKGILACQNSTDCINNNNSVKIKHLFLEFHNFLHLHMMGNNYSLVLSYLY